MAGMENRQRPIATSLKLTRVEAGAFLETWTRRFAKDNVLTYASAIALQLLVAVAALVFLSISLLRPLGAEHAWSRTVTPALAAHLPVEWFGAAVWSIHREISSTSAGLILLGMVVSVWEVSGAIRAIMGALNHIYDVSEQRATWRRFATSIALAVVVSALVVLAAFLGGGAFDPSLAAAGVVERVLAPAAIAYIVVALLVLVAPARRQPWRWVSAGSIGIVVIWISISAGFAYWIGNVIDFRSADGFLALVLSTVGYLYASAIAFLVGAEVDQLAREGGAAAVLGQRRT
jgi:membrane protein